MVRDWDIYNSRERGGIARPALFIIDRDRRVQYSGVDTVASRVPASEVVKLLHSPGSVAALERKVYIPTLADFARVLRTALGDSHKTQ